MEWEMPHAPHALFWIFLQQPSKFSASTSDGKHPQRSTNIQVWVSGGKPKGQFFSCITQLGMSDQTVLGESDESTFTVLQVYQNFIYQIKTKQKFKKIITL